MEHLINIAEVVAGITIVIVTILALDKARDMQKERKRKERNGRY